MTRKSSHISQCNIRNFNPKILLLSSLIFIPILIHAQFENKISINLSGGLFKTFGAKDYPDPYDNEYTYPYLMPNFQTGWTIIGGVQFNYSRKISFEVNIGIARSGFWYYEYYDPWDGEYYSWDCWEIYDEYTDEPIASGENYLTLFNFSVGFAPKYYFLPSKRFKPYAILEINLNYTTVKYIDAEYEEYAKLGREDELDESWTETWMDKSFGIGFSPCIGAEFTVNDNIGVFAQTGYWLILLNKNEFEYPEDEHNFHAFKFQLGVRMSFWKSKKL